MSTVIDALVVELGFDTKGMEEGRKKVEETFNKTKGAAKSTGKTIDEEAAKSGDYISRLRNNVIGLFAAFTFGRGLKDFVSDMTTSNAAIGRFAKSINESVENIAGWRAAGSLMGVSAQDIDSTFQNLTQQFEQFRLTGDSSIVPWFRALGLSMVDDQGKMIPLGDQFLALADKFSSFQDKAEAATIMQNMGISPGMINLILQGRGAVEQLLASQKKLAAAIAADAPAAAARQKAWNEFKNSAETIGIKLLTTLTPALTALTKAGQAFSDWGERHPLIVEAAFAALAGIVIVLSGVMVGVLAGQGIAAVLTGFGALISFGKNLALGLAVLSETMLPALSRAFFALALGIEATPIGWLITGIAALSVVGYELYKHWSEIGNWWKHLWGQMGDDTQKGSDKAKDGIDRLKSGRNTPPAKGDRSSPAKSDKPYAEKDADIEQLQSLGWTREQAIGIVSNIQAESRGKIDATGDSGRAFGLGQWHPDRQQAFAQWAGHSIQTATRSEQVAFINYELRHGAEQQAGKALTATTNADQAARVVTAKYERPADVTGQSDLRAAIAAAFSKPETKEAQAQQPQVTKEAQAQQPKATKEAKAPQAAPTPLHTAIVAATIRSPGAGVGLASGAEGRALASNDNRQTSHVSTSDTKIGEIKVFTQATDAQGIARDLRPALQRDARAQQSNQGPV